MIYTIGHSTRKLDEFISLLEKFGIKLLVDVRRFPSSKKFPWFSKDELSRALAEKDIEYVHLPELGGYRKEGYRKFAESEEFYEAINKLEELIKGRVAAVMCAEIIPFRCHRRYIAHALVLRGHKVIHIINENKTIEHKLTGEIMEKMKRKIRCDKARASNAP